MLEIIYLILLNIIKEWLWSKPWLHSTTHCDRTFIYTEAFLQTNNFINMVSSQLQIQFVLVLSRG